MTTQSGHRKLWTPDDADVSVVSLLSPTPPGQTSSTAIKLVGGGGDATATKSGTTQAVAVCGIGTFVLLFALLYILQPECVLAYPTYDETLVAGKEFSFARAGTLAFFLACLVGVAAALF